MYARSECGNVHRLLRWLVNADLKMNDEDLRGNCRLPVVKVAYFISKYLLHLVNLYFCQGTPW